MIILLFNLHPKIIIFNIKRRAGRRGVGVGEAREDFPSPRALCILFFIFSSSFLADFNVLYKLKTTEPKL